MAVWAWRNDPVTRSMSKSTDKVPWEDHQAWYADHYHEMKIGWIYLARVGVVRVTDGEVSITVAPNWRKEGIGAQLLRSVEGRRATIRRGNEASQRLFERCGYERVNEDADYLFYEAK